MDILFRSQHRYISQVLEVLCCDNKPRYDKEKSSGENIAIADVVGAPVSKKLYSSTLFIGVEYQDGVGLLPFD